jgi:peptide/nickel transport system permease protein
MRIYSSRLQAASVLTFLTRRLTLAALVFVAVSFVSFVLIGVRLDPTWRLQPNPHPYVIKQLQRKFHIHDPIAQRYWLWVKGTVTGEPDVSRPVLSGLPGGAIQGTTAVWSSVLKAARHTTLLMGLSMVVVILCSVVIGTIAAARPGTVLDYVLRTGSYLTWSIPAFLLALGLQYLFAQLAYAHGFRPFALAGVPGSQAGSGLHYVRTWLEYLTLPVLAISAGFVGSYSRYIRSAMLVSLNEQYAVTARAKGLPEWRVVVRHALRNSLLPFISILSLDFGGLFGASLVADYVFKQEGLASYLAAALNDADPFEVEPAILVAAGVVLVFALVADLAVGVVDPRTRLSDAG